MNISKIIENLNKNNISAWYVPKKEDVISKLDQLLAPGDTITVGGSVTLEKCGVTEYLKSGNFNYLDRYAEGLSKEDVGDIFRKAFSADAYISSCNALTEDGLIFNADGNSNRVAAICFGPASVILIVGINKIVPDMAAAHKRLKEIAAPLNAKRLSCDTYCAKNGHCATDEPFAGCSSQGRICCNYVVSGYQRVKGRMKVIIVGEKLGF